MKLILKDYQAVAVATSLRGLRRATRDFIEDSDYSARSLPEAQCLV